MAAAARPGTPPTSRPTLRLVGEDGNAFVILVRLGQALRSAGADAEYIDAVRADAMSGDYDHVLRVAMAEAEIE